MIAPVRHWSDPRHPGEGTWRPSAPHPSGLVDLLVATVALVLAGVVLLGLVVVGRAAMCRIHADDPQPISYCHTTTTETPR